MRKRRLHGLHGKQRIGAVRLQVEVGRYLPDAVHQYIVHGDMTGAEVLGTQQATYFGKVRGGIFEDVRAVGVYDYLRDAFGVQQGLDDVVVERLALKQSVVFTGDALAVVAHRDKGGNGGGVQGTRV